MGNTVKNFLIFIAAIAIGMLANYGIVTLGSIMSPLPDGVIIDSTESFKKNAHLLTTANYSWAFAAHAVGTLVSGIVAGWLASTKSIYYYLGIGAFFLLGGIAAVMMIGGNKTFAVIDLVFAYIPMALLGGYIGRFLRRD